jgi:predicted kinase
MSGRVIIMRGLPGSGKSTYAKSIRGAHIVSADDFFMVGDKYCYDPTKIGAAHVDCMRRFLDFLSSATDCVVVDNTNVTMKEITPYRLVALAMGYSVEIVEIHATVGACIASNTHDVPAEVIAGMSKRWEFQPAAWTQDVGGTQIRIRGK